MRTLVNPSFAQSCSERDLVEFSQNLLDTEPGSLHEENSLATLRGIAGRIRREREAKCAAGKH